MENASKINSNYEAIAWGGLFILWGITEMFKSLPDGTGAVGIGVILISVNVARWLKKVPINVFSTTLGFLALLLGGLQLARPLLHLSFELPIFAVLLLALGVIILARQLTQKGNE